MTQMRSFLWLSSIPLCIHTITSLSVDGHLGCFHVLAIVNSAAMNNKIRVSLSILVSSGYMPEKELAAHSSTLAWKIPWTEEADRLQSMGLLRVRHD